MPKNQFEIPSELRQFAEENVERSRQLYLQLVDGVSQVMGAWAPSSSAAAREFNDVREKAAEFAKVNADAAFTLAKEFAKARDLQEMLTLQTRYVQSQIRTYAEQTQQFGDLISKAFEAASQAQASGPGQFQAKSETNVQQMAMAKPGKEASLGTVGTGANACPQCHGTGKIDGKPCPKCLGTGTVVEGIGGG